MNKFLDKILTKLFPPPEPEVSDFVEVSFIRRCTDGSLVKLTLTGEYASKYGCYLRRSRSYYKFDELMPYWKREEVNEKELLTST